jgi:hypothetical protein
MAYKKQIRILLVQRAKSRGHKPMEEVIQKVYDSNANFCKLYNILQNGILEQADTMGGSP